MSELTLPDGVRAGHWTDAEGLTGCTVVIVPEGSVAAADVRGGASGSRESELLAPGAAQAGPDALLLCGGSAFGLAAADGVVRWLGERGRGFPTPAGPVPLVSAFVVYDLMVGRADARPDAAAGYAACLAAGPVLRSGSLGAGSGCTVGKALGAGGSMRGGLGVASRALPGGAVLVAIAVVNAFGEVLAEDGSLLAGPRGPDGPVRTVEVLAAGRGATPPLGQATTLVCLVTDARLDKREAWLTARAASAGVARSVDPVWTPFDGDACVCLATGVRDTDTLLAGAIAADAAAAAIRDAVRSASALPG